MVVEFCIYSTPAFPNSILGEEDLDILKILTQENENESVSASSFLCFKN